MSKVKEAVKKRILTDVRGLARILFRIFLGQAHDLLSLTHRDLAPLLTLSDRGEGGTLEAPFYLSVYCRWWFMYIFC